MEVINGGVAIRNMARLGNRCAMSCEQLIMATEGTAVIFPGVDLPHRRCSVCCAPVRGSPRLPSTPGDMLAYLTHMPLGVNTAMTTCEAFLPVRLRCETPSFVA